MPKLFFSKALAGKRGRQIFFIRSLTIPKACGTIILWIYGAMVEVSGAHSVDLQNPEDVNELTDKCIPAADKWKYVADEIRKCSGRCGNCAECGR